MHILIDVQGCQSESRFRGIGRSTLEMSRAIIRHSQANGNRASILLNGMYGIDNVNFAKSLYKDLLPAHEMYVFSAIAPTASCNVDNLDRLTAAKQARNLAITNINPDIVFITSFFEGHVDNYIVSIEQAFVRWKTVCVCHDLIPLLNKDRYLSDPGHRAFYMNKLKEYEQADAIVAISQSAVEEVVTYTNIPRDRVFNILSAAGDMFCQHDYPLNEIDTFRAKYAIPEHFILTLAIIEPRKNIEALIHAYSLLPEKVQNDYPMVMAYKVTPEDLTRILALAKGYGIKREQLIFTGFLPDDDLVMLYNLADLFVFPSLHEGFGLPALEAMKCGVPTLGSDATSLPEVIGWDEALFDPRDVHDMAKVIEHSLTDKEFYNRLKAHAIAQAASFSWDKTAAMAVDVFNKVLSDTSGDHLPMLEECVSHQLEIIKHIPSFNNADFLSIAWSIARNSYGKQYKKLLIDISMLVEYDAKTGIQRVSRNLVKEFLAMDIPGYQVAAVYYRSGECYRYANTFMDSHFGTSFGKDEPVFFSHDDVMVVTDLTAHLFPELINELDQLRLAGANACFIVHDILPIRHPEWCSEGVCHDIPIWLEALVGHADRLVCVSESVALDVQSWIEENRATLKINPLLAITHFHLGADLPASKENEAFSSNQQALLTRLSENLGFLMVGTIEPRKGHEQILDAMEVLWARGEDAVLVIVGKAGWSVDELCKRIRQHPEFNKRLFWPSDVSDDYLKALYDAASSLIFASYGEGFGLPLIEAAQRGLPVIARDIPVFREIGQQGAFYFSGKTPVEVAEALSEWLILFEQGKHPKPQDIHWLTWRQSAELLLEKLPLVQMEEGSIVSNAPSEKEAPHAPIE